MTVSDNGERGPVTEREGPTHVALRGSGNQPDLAATGRPVVGVCTTHDQGCCGGCPTAGCRFCRCRRDGGACAHQKRRDGFCEAAAALVQHMHDRSTATLGQIGEAFAETHREEAWADRFRDELMAATKRKGDPREGYLPFDENERCPACGSYLRWQTNCVQCTDPWHEEGRCLDCDYTQDWAHDATEGSDG